MHLIILISNRISYSSTILTNPTSLAIISRNFGGRYGVELIKRGNYVRLPGWLLDSIIIISLPPIRVLLSTGKAASHYISFVLYNGRWCTWFGALNGPGCLPLLPTFSSSYLIANRFPYKPCISTCSRVQSHDYLRSAGLHLWLGFIGK